MACAAVGYAGFESHPRTHVPVGGESCTPLPEPRELRVATVNLAHGRGTAFHQLLEAESTFPERLGAVSTMLEPLKPDVVGLQEADGPSAWSGDLDHVAHLARTGGFCAWLRGVHVDASWFGQRQQYGTALLSRRPLLRGFSQGFDTSSADTKGFVEAEVAGPGGPVLLVSVHLDPISSDARLEQVQLLVRRLSGHQRGLVLLGDFNMDPRGDEPAARALREGLNLRACGGPTYPAHEPWRSLDWVLYSREFSASECRVLDAVVSDHRGVYAVLVPAAGRER